MTGTLGLIGAGMIGGTLARQAVARGMEVVLSNSRGADSLAELVAELGPRARAATPAEAARAGDLVVATVPLHALDQLPADALAGRIVIDTMNYYPQRDRAIGELDSNSVTSSERVQRELPGARVVKAFNSISFFNLANAARPSGAPDRSALPIAGDDVEAKAAVVELLDVLGFDAVDTGSLADSWRSEPGTPVYVQPYLPGTPPEGAGQEEALRWLHENPGEPVTAARVRELVAEAVRGKAGGVLPGGF
ncbi:NADPH-dependent F420 reductase [Actinosynnema mirum]|uniref:NADP oxidoreductase coenzyme F420-dependent n=1 Tax=Actinosynnema mirum (strain ATCC 29888 / DSM 43827 / JCM 3225 / NBRC 14064 / NCIMB 13271 / NRRL B-12336 / IMRU 3971 / 101) TaxID=446462 RepID=C6WRT9_ACTMD|nr:NAD(P)-binding domain-containing protein [Actinosynnema mirum]ACU36931.1 NADP oxidoreductase coenzyme F420-dependent [Actinosynnema mirum DSM 43827]